MSARGTWSGKALLGACVLAGLLSAVGTDASATPAGARPSAADAGAVAVPSAKVDADAVALRGVESAGSRTVEPPTPARPDDLALLPPGAVRSPVASEAIFPTQTVPLRFDHRQHVSTLGVRCIFCHGAAATSDTVEDRLLPEPATACDGCHGSDHRALGSVRPGASPLGRCATCHVGDAKGRDGQVAKVVIPRANLRFSHRRHALRNIGCGQCHGRVAETGLATSLALPRMAGCVACHDATGPAQGEAKADCPTCHLVRADGKLVQAFAAGPLRPPRWMRAAEHTADWIERHRFAAAEDSEFCASCHTSQECITCHDGRVRPRSVHPNDFLSMHPIAARQDSPRCTSCHQQATFCADCHRRVGVARDGPSGNRGAGRRFHPPAAEWTTAPRGPRHHAWEAMRNLGACVSCHSERDCATCHATRGVSGGQGVSPHPPGFGTVCGNALRKNPRPCLVCHASGDRSLGGCR